MDLPIEIRFYILKLLALLQRRNRFDIAVHILTRDLQFPVLFRDRGDFVFGFFRPHPRIHKIMRTTSWVVILQNGQLQRTQFCTFPKQGSIEFCHP